ncbi:MAG: DNA topoisomerase IB [Armatimonadetes bacterium]|nr:DNA topoisomerase IB [Armatimonadota bacterium]
MLRHRHVRETVPARTSKGLDVAHGLCSPHRGQNSGMNREAELTNEHIKANREAAKTAGLRYVTDTAPGIRREGDADTGFRYLNSDGSEVTDEKTLGRIKSIAFPPAYTDTWFCRTANGHLQATGRDAKHRKQFRYHPKWRQVRDENKFDRMMAFGDALSTIRARVAEDLTRRGLPREKVLATVVQLLETTRIRVGNEKYAHTNQHYGLTTLRGEHVRVRGEQITFSFIGKAGVRHKLAVNNRKLARIVKGLHDLPGQELFEYVDAETGSIHPVHSDDVNEYLQEISGNGAVPAPAFTAKDFRTWAGTVQCAMELAAFETVDTQKAVEANVKVAIAKVAATLGNTPAVCKQCYIHPAILTAYTEAGLPDALRSVPGKSGETPDILLPEEQAVMRYLRAQKNN